jgi:hypothetical protein
MTMPTIMLPFTTPRPRVTTLLEAIKEVVNRMVGASMSLDHHGAPTFRAWAEVEHHIQHVARFSGLAETLSVHTQIGPIYGADGEVVDSCALTVEGVLRGPPMQMFLYVLQMVDGEMRIVAVSESARREMIA